MQIISWNVNGIRARIKQGFEESMKEIGADVICIQEFRAHEGQIPKNFLSNYTAYHSIHAKAGYAGSSVFVKTTMPQPLKFWNDYEGGSEAGRVCILEFEKFFLISSYSPNSGAELEKLPRRVEWENGLTAYMKSLTKPIIMCGDLNVAPRPIDAGIKCLAGCSPEEKMAFYDKLNIGMVDVFRYVNPARIDYTWFSNRSKTKIKGLRLDEFVVSKVLAPALKKIEHIHDTNLICGSDHIPVLLEINI